MNICETTGLTCIRCNPGACGHRNIPNLPDDSAQEKLSLIAEWLNEILITQRITIKGMSGEKLIITDQISGEEYVVEDLGYPI